MNMKRQEDNLIRVLRVITRLNVGGPSKQILTLNSIFDGNEFEQLIIAGQVSESEKEIDLASFGRVIKVKSLQRGFNPLNELISIVKIAMIIRSYKPDIIHTHLSKAWAITILAKKFSGANFKVVHTFHGHILHSYFSKWKALILNLVQKFLASNSDCLVAVNDITKKDLIAARIGSEEKYVVIYPGFKALEQHSKINARRRLGLMDDDFTVGFIGRFEEIKRPDILSKVINISLRNSGSTQFIVCGGGELYEGFKNETASPKVHCLPWTNDLSLIYSSVDLMLLTSDNEGSPLTIIEAGQLGVPTLSRAVGGVPSLIAHELTGFLTGDDPEAIANALLRISKSPDLLLEVSAKTKAHFGHNFGELTFLNSYKSLYIKAASN
jgi:glycosyltransferase involved in cell wall biosynthesis